MATDKVRIYDLARELGTPNKVLITILKDKLKITVKSHSSTISIEEADQLKKILNAEKSSDATVKEAPKPEPEKVIPEKKPDYPPREEPQQKQEPPKQTPQKDTVSQPRERKPSYQKPEQTDYKRPTPQLENKPFYRTERQPQTQQHQQKTHKSPTATKETDKKRTAERLYHVSGDKYRHKPEGKTRTEGKVSKYSGRRFQTPQREASTTQTNHTQKVAKPAPLHPGQHQKPVSKPSEQSAETRQKPEEPQTKIKKEFKPHKPEVRPKEKPKFSPAKTKPVAETPDTQTQRPGKPAHKKESQKKKDYFQKDKNKFQDLKPITEVFKKKKQEKKVEEPEKPTEVAILGALTIAELGEILVLSPTEIIKELMKMGIFATLNETITQDSAIEVTEKLGYTIKQATSEGQKTEASTESTKEPAKRLDIDESKLVPRAPIVTILGHVDHGKTTLLDSIRKSKQKLVDAEVGGITQTIGAYAAQLEDGKKVTFIDTPGHHAFTAMRARGAKVTDIAVLIVAADDGIMPQTIEAINHAKAAKVPIVIAINKMDKAGAEKDRILQQLTEHELLPEEWGGETITVPISALKGDGINDLLEMLALVAEVQELKADPTAKATGAVIESELDKGKGPLATVIVQNGTLKIGDYIVVGSVGGKVRALINDMGERVNEAGPSTPVEILGLNEVPEAGDIFEIVNDDKDLKQIINKRKGEEKERKFSSSASTKLQKDSIFKAKLKKDEEERIKELNIIIKADSDGSVKAVEAVLQELKSREVSVKTIHTGVGDITEADVMLASTSNAMIIGFRSKEDPNVAKINSEGQVTIRTYDIIYQISEDIEKTMLGLLKPELKEIELGTAEVRNLFTVGKNFVIAGCYVLEGKIVRNRIATVLRENKEIFRGNLDNLKRFKDDAKEVQSGFECGISFNKFNDLREGDLIKVSQLVEIERESLN